MPESRIQRIGSGSAEATTITIPGTYKAGDIILMFAFRDGSTTNPTIPAGWTSITNTLDGTTCSASIAWKIAASASETSGTWTNATGLMCHVYRGPDHIKPFGTLASNTGILATTIYPTTKGVGLDRMNNQWFVCFQASRAIDTTTMNNPPTGYTNVINAPGATQDMFSFDTNGPVETGFDQNNVAGGGTATGYINAQLPIYPAMQRLNNYQAPRVIGMSVSEKIR